MVIRKRLILFVSLLPLILLLLCLSEAFGQEDFADPFDPFDSRPRRESLFGGDDDDSNKSAEELLFESLELQQREEFLDARTKLLKVLERNPREVRAHLLLADYYLRQVGHFRLALKYIKQGLAIFVEENGRPPYADLSTRSMHADLLNVLSSARLNLDDYKGALRTIEEYESYGYMEPWVPSSKSWILMKLERYDEAIQVAYEGVQLGAAPGATLNVLGILLSMTGKREESLQVFREAIDYEFSLGALGSPATPLNNSGEVYKELFREDEAKTSWRRAVSLPDGCEHVLPSLNLSILLMEEARYPEASKVLDSFEACMAQFPLRNGEEHKALVKMARGRIALHTGRVERAVTLLEEAQSGQQWFGKIGTSIQDHQAAVLTSLGLALQARSHHAETTKAKTWVEWFRLKGQIASDKIRSRWYLRRARLLLMEELNDGEDLYIRHTDSMLEYPSLGSILAAVPYRVLQRKLTRDLGSDNRKVARSYYDSYLTENLLAKGKKSRALEEIDSLLRRLRGREDEALRIHLLVKKAQTLSTESPAYYDTVVTLFNTLRAEIRNAGLLLPVNYDELPREVLQAFEGTPFHLEPSDHSPFWLKWHKTEEGFHRFQFSVTMGPFGSIRVEGAELEETVAKLIEAVFVNPV